MIRKKTSQHGGHGGGHSGGHSGGHGGGHRNNRSRNKYRSGGGGGGGGGHDSQSLARQKKHAQTQKDKYQAMARDMQMNGDRVNAEYYFQHVEHYVRVLAEIAEKEPPQQPRDYAQDSDDQGDASGHEMDAAEHGETHHHQGQRMSHGRHRGEHRTPRHATVNESDATQDEPAAEIPLPGSLFGDDESDRVANG